MPLWLLRLLDSSDCCFTGEPMGLTSGSIIRHMQKIGKRHTHGLSTTKIRAPHISFFVNWPNLTFEDQVFNYWSAEVIKSLRAPGISSPKTSIDGASNWSPYNTWHGDRYNPLELLSHWTRVYKRGQLEIVETTQLMRLIFIRTYLSIICFISTQIISSFLYTRLLTVKTVIRSVNTSK